METTAYYAFGIPVYGLMLALETWSARRRGRPAPAYAPSMGNIMAGIGAITVGIFIGAIVYALYDAAFRTLAIVRWPEGSIVAFIVGLLLADLGHYVHHRFEHGVAALWAVHGVHHQAEEMNLTVSMRHAWFSDVYSFPFYALLPVLGIPPGQFFLATAIMSFHAFVTHTREYDFPSLYVLVTPRTHSLHHAINPAYVNRNFGAMFSIWDRIFGTHVDLDPDVPPVYGSARGYDSHDGAWAQLALWRDLFRAARSKTGLRAKARVFFGKPLSLEIMGAPPPSAAMSKTFSLYVFAQLFVMLVFAVHLFLLRDVHTWSFKVLAAAFVFTTLFALGGLLDARRHGLVCERARLALSAAFGGVLIASRGVPDGTVLGAVLLFGAALGVLSLPSASRSEHLRAP